MSSKVIKCEYWLKDSVNPFIRSLKGPEVTAADVDDTIEYLKQEWKNCREQVVKSKQQIKANRDAFGSDNLYIQGYENFNKYNRYVGIINLMLDILYVYKKQHFQTKKVD